MPRRIEFEGRIVEVPDDATDDEVRQALGGAPAPKAPAGAPPPAATAPQPEESSLLDTVMSGARTAGGIVDQTGRGLAKGMMSLAGAVPDIAGLAGDVGANMLDKIGAPQSVADAYREYNPGAVARRYVGSDALKGALNNANNATADALGVERPRTAPQGVMERMASRGGEELGAALLPIGASYQAAQRLGVEGAKELPSLARMFVEPMAVNPTKTLAKEGAAATAAGMGAASVGELSGKNKAEAEGRPVTTTQQVLDLLGAAGGVGLKGMADAIWSPLKTAVGSMMGSPRMADEVVRDVAVDEIARAAGLAPGKDGAIDTAPLAANIERGNRPSEAIPGFQESTADRTGNSGLAAMEYSRQGGPNAGQYTARRGANTQAIDEAMAKSEPQGTPGALRSELELEQNRQIADAAIVRQNVQDAFDKGIADLRPAMTAEGRGADIRAALEDAHAKVKAAVDDLYKPINESAAAVDVKPLDDKFKGVTDNLSVAEQRRFKPAEADIPGELAEGAQPLREITGIRGALTDQARAARTAGRDNEARVIDQYVRELDTYVDAAIPPELKSQWDAARAARKDAADRFERPQTAIAQTLDRREGQYTQPDSAVPGKFVQDDQGRIADFEALMKEVGSDARVTTAVRDQVLQDVRDRGLLEKPEALQSYLDQYKTLFGRLPDLKKQLGTAQALRRELDAAAGAESALLKEIGPQGKSVVAKYLQYGDENAQKAMQMVMSNKDPSRAADELLSFVGDDPKAVEGARKVFWDIMQSKTRRAGETTADMTGAQPWMPKALQRFVDDPATAAVAERLYRDNPEHWQNIKQIAEAIQGVDVRNSAKAPNTSGTPQGLQEGFLPSTETLASRVFAVERGVVSPVFAGLNVIGIMARKATRKAQAAAVNQAIDKALLDPEWAAQLLRENNPANRAVLRRSAKAWMGAQADTLIDMLEEKTPDDEVKERVMEK